MLRPKALNLAKSPVSLANTREDLEFDTISTQYMENMKKGTLSPANSENEQRRTNSIRKYRLNKLAQLKASSNLFLPNSEGSEKYGPYPLDPRLNKLQKRAEEEVARMNKLPIPNRPYFNYGVDISPPTGSGNSPPAGGSGENSRKKKTTRRLRKNRRSRKRNTRR
jgi:hypothetical protein